MRIDLTDEETAALSRELTDVTGNDRCPLSPRVQTLKAILAKLQRTKAPTFWFFRRDTPYWNERVKLVATLLNNLGTASLTATILVPMFKTEPLPGTVLVAGLIIGVGCFFAAQLISTGMK
jgi:hypothetical protein